MNGALKYTLSQNLKTFRLRAGLSQSDLARKAGSLQPRVAVMESAKNPTLPTLEWLSRVAEALGVTVADLLSEPSGGGLKRLPFLPEDEENLGAHLKNLGASLTGTSARGRSFRPETVLLGVLRTAPAPRMVEALPGLLLKRDIDPDRLLKLSKRRGLVNRLGFVVDTALLLSKESKDRRAASRLSDLSRRLWAERNKGQEEFLMREPPKSPEFRSWIKKKTLPAGKKWGVYGAYSLERFREAFRRAA